jgi:hypothetical protein
MRLFILESYLFTLYFCRVEYQLPNLMAGAITKESIYGAFENGITAENVLFLLKANVFFSWSSLYLVLN